MQVLFLAVGLIMTGHAVLTPLLMVLIMVTGDFLVMSLTTYNVRASSMPNAWKIGNLTIAGIIMGVDELIFCASVMGFGLYRLGPGIETLRTLAFIVIVFGNQATTYTNRERRRLWASRPCFWVVVSSVGDILVATLLAIEGIAMKPLPVLLAGSALAAAIAFAFLLDLVKVPLIARPQLAE